MEISKDKVGLIMSMAKFYINVLLSMNLYPTKGWTVLSLCQAATLNVTVSDYMPCCEISLTLAISSKGLN